MATDNTAALRDDPVRKPPDSRSNSGGALGEPTDIAGAAIFLCSSASDYVHGHVLAVDGGWLAGEKPMPIVIAESRANLLGR